ncbi:GTPase IMAP family member 7-like [Cheilinus undulatus]|uniref:GTPase IMAP family member 7-like n=1 Tax=Cheilinus undulatus TaxID=241271 RepID=UPI001BD5BF09|nr:GTPase IMAP family member 7-like [Cheilinus undulatus]
MDTSDRRIVLLGKTGVGKSSLASTIFGEDSLENNPTPKSDTIKCEVETKSVSGRSITVIDTPGLFDTDRSEDELRAEIVRCVVESAPGPHAFLLLLKVDKYTEHEQAVINKIQEYFSEDVFNYAIAVFTHGDQLGEGQTLEDFVGLDQYLTDHVWKKCGGRCFVIDNKYWQDKPKDEYRSNQFQIKEILKSIDKMIKANKDGYYTNEMYQAVEGEIQEDMKVIRRSSVNMSENEIREKAKKSTTEKLLIGLAGVATGVILGALLGLSTSIMAVMGVVVKQKMSPGLLVKAVTKAAAIGHQAAKGADSPMEAAKKTVEAVKDEAQSVFRGLLHKKNEKSEKKDP